MITVQWLPEMGRLKPLLKMQMRAAARLLGARIKLIECIR